MKVSEDKFVTIDYTLKLTNGELVETSEGGAPFGFVFGRSQIIPGLEKGLKGLEEGETATIKVTPEEGYGERREELLQGIPRNYFPQDADLRPGAAFQTMGPQGPVTFTIHEVQEDTVIADFNHPLAGETLLFDIKVTEVRDATPEELQAALGACSTESCGTCGGGCC